MFFRCQEHFSVPAFYETQYKAYYPCFITYITWKVSEEFLSGFIFGLLFLFLSKDWIGFS